MALDLVDPFIYLTESPVVPVQSLLNPIKPLIQTMDKPVKAFIKILKEFLIHTASAAKSNSKPLCLSCQ